MASENKPNGERVELDQSDFNDLVRGTLDIQDDETKDTKGEERTEETRETRVDPRESAARDTKRREPEVQVEDEEDPRDKRIAELERTVRETQDLVRAPRGVERREPDIEFVDYGGARLPKDKNRWPVKLNDELWKAVGIDDSARPGLETLANLLYMRVVDAANELVQRGVNQRMQRDTRESTFFTEYPDLKDHRDIAELVELQARNEGIAERFAKDSRGYMNEVGRRTRQRLAAIRGVTLEEYERSLGGGSTDTSRSRSTSTTTSRAVTTSAGSRGGRGVDTRNQNRKEMDDMWNG
jgi:hypothetical protein